jgi:hypothetical protein
MCDDRPIAVQTPEPVVFTLDSMERDEIRNVRDSSLLHLQCHIGLDTASHSLNN